MFSPPLMIISLILPCTESDRPADLAGVARGEPALAVLRVVPSR